MTLPAANSPPPAIPDHDLIACVGRGSYGEVWLGRSVTGSFRAIKVIRRETFSDERPFEREFNGIQRYEPISRTHPGLVAILHVGRNPDAGYFYYVMEVADDLRDGPAIVPARYVPLTLREIIRGQTISLDRALGWGLLLADALGHLHRHGLVHRDIKPSNIIFAQGAPKIADIGLVTHLGERATGVGTIGYVPPEGPGQPSADVFSLGKVLYELSLGKTVDQYPELPTGLQNLPEAPGLLQLNQIILRACDPDPQKRFQSAPDLRAALAALLAEQKPSSHQPDTTPSRPSQSDGDAPRVLIVFADDSELDRQIAGQLAQQCVELGAEILFQQAAESTVAWARRFEAHISRTQAAFVLLSPHSIRQEMVAYAVELMRQVREKAVPANPTPLRVMSVNIQLSGPLPRTLALGLADCPMVVWDKPADAVPLGQAVNAWLRPNPITQPSTISSIR